MISFYSFCQSQYQVTFKRPLLILLGAIILLMRPIYAFSQTSPLPSDTLYLHSNWFARRADQTSQDGTQLTAHPLNTDNWLPATVPGTVLTTLLQNHKYPDPNIGLNNKLIPDIADSGASFYTYWFYTSFKSPGQETGNHTWLHFNGINYSAQIFLNGKRINTDTHRGMFLRECYDVTPSLKKDSLNQLAVLVYPPEPVGVANGGQAGDGTIGKSVTNQYVAGWDWMAPVHDRNTGIWDDVFLTTTGPVLIRAPFVRSVVPGTRKPGNDQPPAYLKTSATLFNADSIPHSGELRVSVNGNLIDTSYTLNPGEQKIVALPRMKIDHPKLWWPNGLGKHPLYTVQFVASVSGSEVSDKAIVSTGIREITSDMDHHLRGRIFKVNGQPVFIRGGNWITSDWMLRLSRERYNAEIRYMAGMHLNMLRVWGGGITERPDFYNACDRNGILVMQDLWITGDADGAWHDPKKKDSRARRRFYPDDHGLFLASAADQVKMLRNHPSLCFWDGGNEQAPPADILRTLQNRIMPNLDPDRLFVSHSTSLELYFHPDSLVGDGPYGIQPLNRFFTHRSFPFNPEVGSVGLPEAGTLHKIFPNNDSIPDGKGFVPTEWQYHKYIPYVDRNGKDYIRQYGFVDNMNTFADYAQLANYNQYRALFEGWNAHMWKWYTGVMIWKLQNPWTALRGQFYDWYLNPTGAMFGLMKGAEPIHIQYDPATKAIQVVNNTFDPIDNANVTATWYNLAGNPIPAGKRIVTIGANQVDSVFTVDGKSVESNVFFLQLVLKDRSGKLLSQNFYWLHKPDLDYVDLKELNRAKVRISARLIHTNTGEKIAVTLQNRARVSHGPVAFWIHLQLYDPDTGTRITPVFYSDNYISLVPGEKRALTIGLGQNYLENHKTPKLEIFGWNLPSKTISIK